MRRVAPSYPLWAWPEALVLAATALLCLRSPWSGALAYEFSFFLGIVASLTFTFFPGLRLEHIRRSRPISRTDIARLLSTPLTHLLLPLAIVLIASRSIPTCRYDIGVAWFLLLPLVSAIFGASCAVWGNGSVWKALTPTLLFSLLTARDLLLDPPLSFLHPAFGFYAGTLYEEWLPITLPIITYRLWTAALSAWLVASWKRPRILAGLAILGCLLFRPQLGWFHSGAAIQSRLGGEISNEHLRFYFPEHALTRSEAGRAFDLLDFRATSIAKELGVPSRSVEVYLYPSADLKQRWTGLRTTAIGNPIQGALHLPAGEDFTSPLVVHELTHVLAAPFGLPGIGLPKNPGLLEGLATAMQYYSGELSVHEWAQTMRTFDLLPDLNRALAPSGFWREPPARAYLTAGSFCRWLIDRSNMHLFGRIYRGETFQSVYGAPLATLVKSWEMFLERRPMSPAVLSIAEPILREKAVFDRRCPHDVAAASGEARACVNDGELAEARTRGEKARIFSGGAPRYTLDLARLEIKLGKGKEAEALVAPLLEQEKLTAYDRFRAHLLAGDAAALLERPTDAVHQYLFALRTAPSTERLALEARASLLVTDRKQALRELLLNPSQTALLKSALTWRKEPRLLPFFLYAAQLSLYLRDPLQARNFIDRTSSVDPNLLPLRLELMARLLEVEKKPCEAERVYKELEKFARTEGRILYLRDQQVRLAKGLEKPF